MIKIVWTVLFWHTFSLCKRHSVHLKHLSSSNSPNLLLSRHSDAETPLEHEIKRSKKIDYKITSELSRPITDKNFHNANIPVYEPYHLTEKQEDIILLHE